MATTVINQENDCYFICGDEKIPARKGPLAIISPVFNSMFYGGMAASEIELLDISSSDFKQVLNFIYTKNVNIENLQNAWALIYISQKYFLRSLLDVCADYVIDNTTMDNLLLNYEYAQLYNIKEIIDFCWKNILYFSKGLLYVNYHMQLPTLTLLLDEAKLNMSCVDTCMLIFKWALDECEINNKNISFDNILKVLRENELLKNLNFNLENLRLYEFTDYMKQLDCYSKISDIRYNFVIDIYLEKLRLLSNDNERMEFIGNLYKRDKSIKAFTEPFFYRYLYKISRGYFFSNQLPVVSDITVSRNVYLFGLSITTMHQPAGVSRSTYTSKVDIKILTDNVTYYVCNFDNIEGVFYNSVQTLSFPIPIRLEAKKVYSVIIVYYNDDVSKKAQIVLNYCSEKLFYKKSVIASFSNELDGSVLQGISYFIA